MRAEERLFQLGFFQLEEKCETTGLIMAEKMWA